MYRLLSIVTGLTLLLICTPISAKENKAKDPQAMMETYQKLATPGEPHKQLASLTGTWTTHTKEWMEPGKPPTDPRARATLKCCLTAALFKRTVRVR